MGNSYFEPIEAAGGGLDELPVAVAGTGDRILTSIAVLSVLCVH